LKDKRANRDDWSQNTSFYSDSEPFVIVHPVASTKLADGKECELVDVERNVYSQVTIGYKNNNQ